MTHTFIQQNRITLSLDPVGDGVDITEGNYPEDDAVIFISRDRIAAMIDFLSAVLAELEKGDAQ
jgi:hypothetical protein